MVYCYGGHGLVVGLDDLRDVSSLNNSVILWFKCDSYCQQWTVKWAITGAVGPIGAGSCQELNAGLKMW